jgi:MFS family permease
MTIKKGALPATLAVVIALIFSATSLFISTFALFLKPVSDEFHWSLAIFPQSMLVCSVVYALSAPLTGRAADRLGARGVVMVGVLVTAIGFYAISLMSGSMWQMYGCAVIIGMAAALVSPATLSGVVAGWWNSGRALVMGATLGAAPMLATAALSPLIASLISQHGWRITFRGISVITLCVSGFFVLAFLRQAQVIDQTKDSTSEHPTGLTQLLGTTDASQGMTLKEALRGGSFWLVLGISLALAFMFGGVSGHLVALLADRGQSAEFGAVLLSAIFIGGVIAPIVAGAVVDRFTRPQVLLPFMAAPLLGLLLLTVQTQPLPTVLGAALIGVGFNAWIGQMPFLVTRYFGLRSAGEITGTLVSVGGVSIGVGPVVVGVMRTAYGDYQSALWLCIGLIVAALIGIALLRPYPVTQPQVDSPSPASAIQ